MKSEIVGMDTINPATKKDKVGAEEFIYGYIAKMMHLIISAFLILFSGWTLSAHVCVLFGLNLKALLLIAPLVIISLFGTYFLLPATKSSFFLNRNIFWSGRTWITNKNIFLVSLTALVILPAFIYWSYIAFWILSVSLLMLCLLRLDAGKPLVFDNDVNNPRKSNVLIVALLSLTAVALSYAVSRSDLDDSFYVAVAAFLSSNPAHPLIATDPMLGEPGFPLIFPSYRFASFELLSGAVAYLLSVPAMDVYYIYLLPVWVVAAVVAIFLLTKELIPKHWLLAGVVALFLTLLLGEMHRSPANFSFVRIFQGKAVFLSVIVPTIFYLTARFFSERGTKADLFLLACCQVASIGLTNFGMLMGPIAGFGALMSNIPLALKSGLIKLYCAFAILLLPIPYLINVALQSKSSPIMNFVAETASNVWASVFGFHQQYLVGILLLAGPVLAKDVITTWRLAVPPFLLFAIYLNPWLSGFISKYVTTPPVYWRVVWSFPILVFAAVSFSMIAIELFERKTHRLIPALLSAIVFILTLYSLSFNTLRPENIGSVEGFAAWKVPGAHLVVAQKAIKIDSDGGRLLAPDEIAGLISRFEHHPRLVSTRGLYLDLMGPSIGGVEYTPRRVLYDFVTGKTEQKTEVVRLALSTLDVSVIVLNINNETKDITLLLRSEGYKQREWINDYSIWTK